MVAGSEAALVFEITVLEPEEVEHSVESNRIDALLGACHHAWLGMEGYTQTAMVCARFTFSTCAMSFSSSALRVPSTISPT